MPADLIPLHLIATDVAAEGLDLRRAARVVHYDLPWTHIRLEQREGRARRSASTHREIELVRFDPPPTVEARLRQLAALATKRVLPARAGLGTEGRRLWRWQADVSEELGRAAIASGAKAECAAEALGHVAAVALEPPGALAGFTLHAPAETPGVLAVPEGWLVWLDLEGRASDDPDVLTARLRACVNNAAATVDPVAIRTALRRLAPIARERLRVLTLAQWDGATPAVPARRLIAQLQELIGTAVRRRDAEELALLDRALRFASGGHTAGEIALLEDLASAPTRELQARLGSLPSPTRRAVTADVRLAGLVIFTGGTEDGINGDS